MGTASLWQARLLLPALLLMIPALSAALLGLKRFDHPVLSLHRLFVMVMALVLAVTFFSQVIGLVELNPLAYIAGAETRDSFMLRQVGPYAEAMTALAALPPAARVQFLWEPRSYMAARPVRADPLLDALPHLTATTGSLPAAVQQLKAEGFTHVLVYELGAKLVMGELPRLYTPHDQQNLQDLESQYARKVFENRYYRLLELQ